MTIVGQLPTAGYVIAPTQVLTRALISVHVQGLAKGLKQTAWHEI